MNNNELLPLMGGMLNGPAFLSDDKIASCKTYREAVCLAWDERRSKGMTRDRLGELCCLLPQHISDYFSRNELNPKGQRRRSLPADKIHDVESALGNRAITQYLVRQAQLTLMEEMLAQRTQRAA
jgi:hypothetical protein